MVMLHYQNKRTMNPKTKQKKKGDIEIPLQWQLVARDDRNKLSSNLSKLEYEGQSLRKSVFIKFEEDKPGLM